MHASVISHLCSAEHAAAAGQAGACLSWPQGDRYQLRPYGLRELGQEGCKLLLIHADEQVNVLAHCRLDGVQGGLHICSTLAKGRAAEH